MMTHSLFIADLHLRPERPAPRTAFREFLAGPAAGCAQLFILGDLFDVWPGPEMVSAPDFAEELDALAGLTRRGVRVVIFKGNRDFYFGGRETPARRGVPSRNRLVRRLGCEVVSDYRVESFGPYRAYLCHGDLLCAGDYRYQAMRRVLRSPLVAASAEALPLCVGRWLARRGRQISRAEIARKLEARTNLDLCPATLGRVFRGRGDLVRWGLGPRTGVVDVLICGHIHRPAVRDYTVDGRSVRVYVLGPWEPPASAVAKSQLLAAGPKPPPDEPSRVTPIWLEFTTETGFRLHGLPAEG